MKQFLQVYFFNKKVGLLSKEGKSLTFQYDSYYLKEKEPAPISLSLPLTNEVYSPEKTESFFQSLLPDETIKLKISKILSISETNTFGLLEALGGDCAGAIALYPENSSPCPTESYQTSPML